MSVLTPAGSPLADPSALPIVGHPSDVVAHDFLPAVGALFALYLAALLALFLVTLVFKVTARTGAHHVHSRVHSRRRLVVLPEETLPTPVPGVVS